MKRRLMDELVARRRAKLWSAMNPGTPREMGRFRKNSIGCLVTQCSLCKGHKYPKRIPSKKEVFDECGNCGIRRVGAGRCVCMVGAGSDEGLRAA